MSASDKALFDKVQNDEDVDIKDLISGPWDEEIKAHPERNLRFLTSLIE